MVNQVSDSRGGYDFMLPMWTSLRQIWQELAKYLAYHNIFCHMALLELKGLTLWNFSILVNYYFSGFLQFKGNIACGQNNSSIRDSAPLTEASAYDQTLPHSLSHSDLFVTGIHAKKKKKPWPSYQSPFRPSLNLAGKTAKKKSTVS